MFKKLSVAILAVLLIASITYAVHDGFFRGLFVVTNATIGKDLTVTGTSAFTGAITSAGNVTLGDAVSDVITPTGYMTYVRIGTGTTFGTIGTVAADELGVEGDSEFDGSVQMDGVVTVAQKVKTSSGVGAIVANKCSAVEYGDGVRHQTVLTFTLTGDHDLDLADGDHGTGIKVYDFPAGRINIEGATIDASIAHNGAFNASADDLFHVACGTVVGADDNALTGTEADLIPSSDLDTVSGGTSPLDWHSALAASAQFDGTSSAKDLYVNVAVEATDNSGATTYAVTGTMTITWVNLGTY